MHQQQGMASCFKKGTIEEKHVTASMEVGLWAGNNWNLRGKDGTLRGEDERRREAKWEWQKGGREGKIEAEAGTK